MKKGNYFKKIGSFAFVIAALTFTSCKPDEVAPPKAENEEEIITDIKLVFTNDADTNDVVEASVKDPDGAGVQELEVLNAINLDKNKTYTLTLEIMNKLKSPGEDITEEIKEEGDEHQFFFGFTNNAFSNPLGNGNIDNAQDSLQYKDEDSNGNPIGLSTSWQTSSSELKNGKFSIRLQHQPDLKSATTGASDGDTDFELAFDLIID
jgi:hypothetical protein